MNEMTYGQALSEIRQCFKAKSHQDLEGMRRILDLERKVGLWSNRFKKFEDLLKEEKLCSINIWKTFKLVIRPGELRNSVDSIGVEAACFIARQPQKTQSKLIKTGVDYFNEYNQAPPVQVYQAQIRSGPSPTKRKAAKQRSIIDFWKARASQLEKILRENNIRVPKLRES